MSTTEVDNERENGYRTRVRLRKGHVIFALMILFNILQRALWSLSLSAGHSLARL